jgi:hypothetical protein
VTGELVLLVIGLVVTAATAGVHLWAMRPALTDAGVAIALVALVFIFLVLIVAEAAE